MSAPRAGDELRREFLARAGAASDATCPDANQIWAAVRGDLPREDIHVVVDHTAGCPACAAAWRLAQELMNADADFAATAATPPGGTRTWMLWTPLAAAAAIVVAAGVFFVQRSAHEGPPPGYRATRPVVVESLTPENRALSRANCVLRWTASPSGSRYDVRVMDPDLNLIAEVRGLERAECVVPEAALAGLPPGEHVLWQVTVVSPGGRRFTGPTFRNRIE
jgi:hypothetical protein